jgi:hypothetical protein
VLLRSVFFLRHLILLLEDRLYYVNRDGFVLFSSMNVGIRCLLVLFCLDTLFCSVQVCT